MNEYIGKTYPIEENRKRINTNGSNGYENAFTYKTQLVLIYNLNNGRIMRIWKYILKIDDEQVISIPVGAEILSVQIQRDSLCLWALCDDSKIQVDRKIAIYGTGNPIPDKPGKFVSTFQLGNGLVFHIFDLGYTN